MKPRFTLASFVLPLALLSGLHAADKQPSLLVGNAAEVQRTYVVAKIQAKLDRGVSSAADFAPELKNLEEQAAKYAEYPELAADFAMVKAGLYLDGLNDRAQGRKLLTAVTRDYAGTPSAKQAAQVLGLLDQMEKRDAADDDLLPVAQKITDKAKAGSHTEAAFAPELAKLDALVTKYAANREAAANLALAKAVFYVRVLEDSAQGRKLLLAITTGYRDTLAAARAQETLEGLEPSPQR